MSKIIIIIIIFLTFIFNEVGVSTATINLNNENSTNSIKPYLGNVDAGANITVSDAIMVLRHIVGLVILNDDAYQRADVNLDGTVDVIDAISILRHIVGLTEKFIPVDPARISTSGGLQYAVNAANVSEIKILKNINIDGEQEITVSRDIIISSVDSERKSINGTITLKENTRSFTGLNLVIETINIDAGEDEITVVFNGCKVDQVNFYSDARVEGAGNIRDGGIFIAPGVSVLFIGVSSIDPDNSSFDYRPVIRTGEDMIFNLNLRDNNNHPLNEIFHIEIQHLFSENRGFTNGEASVIIKDMAEGEYSGIVFVNGIDLGNYEISVQQHMSLYLFYDNLGYSDHLGGVGEILLETRDKFGNTYLPDVDEEIMVSAVLSEGSFTEGSITEKKIEIEDGIAKVVFEDGDLIVNGGGETNDLRIVFTATGFFTAYTVKFNVLGLSDIDTESSIISIFPDNTVTAGEPVKIDISLKDVNGNPVSGAFVTYIGDDTFPEMTIDFTNGEVLDYDENGIASVTFSQDRAGEYRDIKLFVDGKLIDSLTFTVNRGEAAILKPPPEAPKMSGIRVDDPVMVTLLVTDDYGNPVSGKEVFWLGILDNEKNFHEVGNLSDVSDDLGFVKFTNIKISEYGDYKLLFSFDEDYIPDSQTPHFYYDVYVWSNDSSLFWIGYDDVLEITAGRAFHIGVLLPDDIENSGSPEEAFSIRAQNINKNEIEIIINYIDEDPVNGFFTLSLKYTGESPAENIDANLTIYYNNIALKKEVPLLIKKP